MLIELKCRIFRKLHFSGKWLAFIGSMTCIFLDDDLYLFGWWLEYFLFVLFWIFQGDNLHFLGRLLAFFVDDLQFSVDDFNFSAGDFYTLFFFLAYLRKTITFFVYISGLK